MRMKNLLAFCIAGLSCLVLTAHAHEYQTQHQAQHQASSLAVSVAFDAAGNLWRAAPKATLYRLI